MGVILYSQGTSGNVWNHFVVIKGRGTGFLGVRPGLLLKHPPESTHMIKNDLTPDVNSAKVENF